ncbi:hypothetical protein M9Y10_043256 [Tritrichomonas musculus]|uniref:Intimal thickness related receptor IRP domain-containing protein n=1 Tax=Tritrichomonas musculus TaxID=1915356 RepID=A0ABR2K245_9EUKA
MLIFFFCFADSLPPFKELNLEISFSGLHPKNNYFKSYPIIGFHSCAKKRIKVIQKFREKYVVLAFENLNNTHYISKHCPQLIIDQSEINRITKIAPNGYFDFYLNNFSMNQTVDAGGFDKDTNMGILYTDYLISISNDNFVVKPLNSLKLDRSLPVIVVSINFYLFIENGFNNNPNHFLPNHHFLPSYIPYYSFLTFIPAIFMCIIWSRKSKANHIPLLSNFYKISLFIPNTLLFGSSGLIIIIQTVAYFFVKNSQPIQISFFNNLVFLSLLLPISLRVFQGRIMNLYVGEADFASASLGTVFFPHATAVIFNAFNVLIFHSYRFQNAFYFSFLFFSYLAILFIVTRGIGYYTLAILPKDFHLLFEREQEIGPQTFQNNPIKMPNIFSLLIYGILVAAWFSKMADHLLLVSMNLAEFDINLVFTFFFTFLSFSALFSCIRTRYRTSGKKERGSWQEDHILYNVVAALFVSIYMFADMIFIRKVNCFEMLLHSFGMIYTTFGIIFECGSAISFLFAFIQVYFSILRYQTK